VFMNAGTHLGETKDKLYKVVVYFFKKPPVLLDVGDIGNARFIEFTQNQFKYEYRKNLFVPEEALIYAAEWVIQKDTPNNIKTTIDKILMRRKETQPIDHPSCGSVFKNPKNKKAWQVIDDLWLRGYQIGGAQFSEKHCNFIINLGTAKASDIKTLIDLAKSRAKQELGIELEEEVKYLGF
ncbi:MAG: hypothetical protein HY843_06805, partial [Bdellovibrio sp.]|nr:hypothetical protein [Bdellovibrio sp.]